VVAHPQRYKLTGSWLGRLLLEFKSTGGEALEVGGGYHLGVLDAVATLALARVELDEGGEGIKAVAVGGIAGVGKREKLIKRGGGQHRVGHLFLVGN